MEIKSFEDQFDELSKAHRHYSRVKGTFEYFTKHVLRFINETMGPHLGLSCAVNDDALTIRSPITSIRIAFACTADSAGAQACIVVHRIPVDLAFEEMVLIAKIPVNYEGNTGLKISKRDLNVTIDTDAYCLTMHLLQLASHHPLVHLTGASVTSG